MDLDWLKRAFGVLPQEYLCVAKENVIAAQNVYLSHKDSSTLVDVSNKHLLLGYNPLIMAVRIDGGPNNICLSFGHDEKKKSTRWRGFLSDESSIAHIELKKVNNAFDIPSWSFFVGVYGEHQFLSGHQWLANTARMALRPKPASNANISGNLYDQVRIAYSTPRQISVITVKDNDLLNFFPTDLHGRLDSDYYVSSLRIGGMACNQVEACKRVVISTVNVAAFKEVYALGKNHMQSFQPENHFQTSMIKSPGGIPVYPLATRYLEMEVIRHTDIGIHRVFLYRITAEADVAEGKTLAHLHSWYVQWRLNHGMSTEYFLR